MAGEDGSTVQPVPLSEEEKQRTLKEHLFPRHLFPEKYQDEPPQGTQTEGESGKNQTISN
jgi:hypothetical protein